MRPSLPLLFCLLLAGCQPDKGDPASASGPRPASGPVTLEGEQAADVAEAEPQLVAMGDFTIVAVLLGNSLDADRVVINDSDRFERKDALHASVLSTGAHQGLRLTARWLAADGSLIAETEQPLVPTAATATTFSVSHPDGWPSGDYQLQIAINGQTLRSRDFQVR